jgi:hypothetical protein
VRLEEMPESRRIAVAVIEPERLKCPQAGEEVPPCQQIVVSAHPSQVSVLSGFQRRNVLLLLLLGARYHLRVLSIATPTKHEQTFMIKLAHFAYEDSARPVIVLMPAFPTRPGVPPRDCHSVVRYLLHPAPASD